jgi:hypothetical protein
LGSLERSVLDRLERSILYSKRVYSLNGNLSEVTSQYNYNNVYHHDQS